MFLQDSNTGRTPGVPTRVNSPYEVAFTLTGQTAAVTVPAPAELALLAIGALAAGVARRRRA